MRYNGDYFYDVATTFDQEHIKCKTHRQDYYSSQSGVLLPALETLRQ